MSTVELIVVLAFSLAGISWCVWLWGRVNGEHTAKLLEELSALRRDNRVLMEALAAKAGNPIVFERPQPRKSERWFESKPTLTVGEKS
jgi:hypothetical protein